MQDQDQNSADDPGVYSLTLGWEPDGKPAVDGQVGPSIFVAIQEQLGLQLQSGNDLVEPLIIDTAQKLPIKDSRVWAPTTSTMHERAVATELARGERRP